jgi:hypothetical protein
MGVYVIASLTIKDAVRLEDYKPSAQSVWDTKPRGSSLQS